MTSENKYSAYDQELRKYSDAAYRKWLFFGLILIFCHLLDFQTEEVNIFSNKVTINSPYILLGLLGLIYVHYLYEALFTQYISGVINPFKLDRRLMRSFVRNSQKKGRKVRIVKIHAAIRHWIFFTLLAPYFLTICSIMVFAFFLSVYDISNLAMYLWDNSSLIKYLASWF